MMVCLQAVLAVLHPLAYMLRHALSGLRLAIISNCRQTRSISDLIRASLRVCSFAINLQRTPSCSDSHRCWMVSHRVVLARRLLRCGDFQRQAIARASDDIYLPVMPMAVDLYYILGIAAVVAAAFAAVCLET